MSIIEIIGWILICFSFYLIVAAILLIALLNWESNHVVECNKEDE